MQKNIIAVKFLKKVSIQIKLLILKITYTILSVIKLVNYKKKIENLYFMKKTII